jgi:hypothetical protein
MRLLTPEEEESLKELFQLNAQELKTVLDCLCYTFEQVGIRIYLSIHTVNIFDLLQAAFTSTGPEALFEVLLNSGFDEPHAKVRKKKTFIFFPAG